VAFCKEMGKRGRPARRGEGGSDVRGEVEESEEDKEVGRHVCGVCKDAGKTGGNWIRCDCCTSWFHQKCGKVSVGLCKALNSFGKGASGGTGTGLHWYCSDCYEEVRSMVAELRSVRERRGVMGSELSGLRIVGEGEGMSEDLEGVKNVREEDDGRGVGGGVEDVVERAIGKIWKELATMKARQGAVEKELNAVKVDLLEEGAKVEEVGDLARVAEERVKEVDGILVKFGRGMDVMEGKLEDLAGVVKEVREVKESIKYGMEGEFGEYRGRVGILEGGLWDLEEQLSDYFPALEKGMEKVKENIKKIREEKRPGEEMGRSNESGDLLPVVKDDHEERGGVGACVGGWEEVKENRKKIRKEKRSREEMGRSNESEDLLPVVTREGGREVEAELRNNRSKEVRSREEVGTSGEGGDLLPVVRNDQEERDAERGVVGASVGGRGVSCRGHGSVVGGGDGDMRAQLTEEEERERRKFNLMFMGIKEGSAEEGEMVVRGLVKVLLGGEYVGLRVGERVGRKGVKDRPIRVVVEEAGQRRKILARAKDLKTMEGKGGIYIAPDRTRKQQEEDRVLRDKVKEFRKGGKVGVKISKGKVVREEGGNRDVLFRLDS